MRAYVIMPGADVKVEEQTLPDHLDRLVVPIQTPPRFEAADAPMPTIAEAYPTMILDRHTIRHADPRTPHTVTAFWPSSWRDRWGMDALRAEGVIS